ncbi:MAG: fabH [Fibrobacteres bacterium]|nr:fabH [Fibrobacterota bacterium]
MGAVFRGIGVYYPETVLTNSDIEKIVETTDEWITTRTGIKQRHIIPKGSPLKASDFGTFAAKAALEKAGVGPDEIDGIICANINPDKQFPATACFIQAKLGVKNGFAFDVTAACAGFVYAVNMAALLIDAGQCRNVLVIGAEIISPVLDWTDRNTCILFGDAAGAVVVGKGPEGRGLIRSQLKSDGTQSEVLYLNLPGDEGRRGMFMDGKQVFKAAVTEVTDIVRSTVAQAGFKVEDLDLLVLHQANVRILNAIAEKLGLPPEKVLINVHKFGNTSSASIPLALHEADGEGRLKPGMLVALAAVGGGMSWGCNLMRW